MIRALQFAGILLVGSVVGFCEEQKGGGAKAVPPPAMRVPPPRPNLNRGGAPNGNPNKGYPNARPKLGPPITNPANPIVRLFGMAPEERERAIEKLPPERQEQARKQFDWFDHMSKEDQKAVLDRFSRYDALTPEQQRAFKQQLQALGKLEPDRRRLVGLAVRQLETKSEAERTVMLNSERFKTMFTPEEQQIISDLSTVIFPPM